MSFKVAVLFYIPDPYMLHDAVVHIIYLVLLILSSFSISNTISDIFGL